MNSNINEKLVEMVKKYECLYNTDIKEYRNVDKKKLIWKKIGAALNTSDNVCLKRWRTLRDSHKRYNKILESGKTSKIPKWKYAELMSFLNNFNTSKNLSIRSNEYKLEDYDDSYMEDGFETVEYPMNQSHQEDVSVEDFNTASNSNDSSSENRKPSTTHEDDDDDLEIKSAITGMLEKCCGKLDELMSDAPNEARTSTSRLFEGLANKITSSGLSQSAINDIELEVVKLVYAFIVEQTS